MTRHENRRPPSSRTNTMGVCPRSLSLSLASLASAPPPPPSSRMSKPVLGMRHLNLSNPVTTALPAPHCSPFSLFCVFHSRALSHALARASPYCSPSHVIVLSAHCFPMYLASFDCHLETLVSTSCLQVSPHVLRSVDTSLNTRLSPALLVEPSSSLAAQRLARRSCLSRSFPLFARHSVVTLSRNYPP